MGQRDEGMPQQTNRPERRSTQQPCSPKLCAERVPSEQKSRKKTNKQTTMTNDLLHHAWPTPPMGTGGAGPPS